MSGELLTFVFTDLEGSTRLWDEYPAEMGPALEQHDALLHASMSGVGGEVVKSTGDGLMAAFTSPGAALTACIQAQRGMESITVGGAGDLESAQRAYTAAAAAGDEAGVLMPQLEATTRLVAMQLATGADQVDLAGLRSIYDAFEEGFDLPELVEARRLIDGDHPVTA